MLSPGCEYSAARNVSWKSSSRTAVPFAHAAHSHSKRASGPRPNTAAPSFRGCAMACARAVITGWRFSEAEATAALSMMRLPIISATSSSTGHRVGGDFGDLPGELGLARQALLFLVGADLVQDHGACPTVSATTLPVMAALVAALHEHCLRPG